MRYRRIFSLLLFSAFICFFSGCGKATLDSGDIISDSTVLSNGAFICNTIDTSFISGNFFVYGVYTNESDYSYVLGSYDYVNNSDELYYFRFDRAGKVITSGLLDTPIYIKDSAIHYSDAFSQSLPSDSIDCTDCSISFFSLDFDDSGAFSSYCEVYGFVYHEEDDTGSDFVNNYFIKWDNNGKCISVEAVDNIVYSVYENTDIHTDSTGKTFKADSSGISMFDSDNNYVGSYFDFMNSDIVSSGFDMFVVSDEDSFSGIYTDLNGNTVLGSFVRKTDHLDNSKVLILACSGVDNKIKDDVLRFNNDNNGYRIYIDDYSVKNINSDITQGWTELKADIINGYDPDIILDYSGYDPGFISRMSRDSRLCDLSDVINKDKELKDFEISDKASSLFYPDKEIYAVVPSYIYRTVIGSTDVFGTDQTWDEYKLISYLEPLVDDHVIFYGETKDTFLSNILEFNGYTYIDVNSCTADFDNEGFINYLKLASHLSDDEAEASEKQYSETNLGQTLLLDNYGYCLGDMHLEYSNYAKGTYYDLGIPAGVNNGSGVYVASMSFMISAGHAYTNECWDFIKKFLTEEYQENLEFSIPVSSAAYDIWLNDTAPKSNNQLLFTYTKDGMEYYIWPAEDSEADYLRNNLNSCRRLEFKDYAVEQIVLQYADQFFDGQITAEEAASSIDRDVEAYLAS